MDKHNINLFLDQTSLKSEHDERRSVVVYWNVEFDRSLDGYLNKRKYKHDFSLLKEGVGRLEIQFNYDTKFTKQQNFGYVEALAAKHLVSSLGLNVFGFSDESMSVRRDQLHINFSQIDALKLICRDATSQEYLSELSTLTGRTSTSAGYLYGVTGSITASSEWLKDGITEFDYYNTAIDIDIREADLLTTVYGEISIDYRSVHEYMNSDWVQFTILAKGMTYPRAYSTVYDIAKSANQLIYDEDNGYLKKIRSKFGPECMLLFNKEQLSYLPLAPLKPGTYYVLGFRKYINPVVLEEMHCHGIALNYEQTLTPDELEDFKKNRAY